MVSVRYENIWELIRKKDFRLIVEISDDYKCTLCKDILRNACSAPCGCRFCKDCISNHLDGLDPYCPGESDHCKEETISFVTHVQVDHAINSRIAKLIVKCPEESCDFCDELQKIDTHLETCSSRQLRRSVAVESFPSTTGNSSHSSQILMDCIDNLKNELATMRAEMRLMQADSERKRLELTQLTAEGRGRRDEISALRFDLDDVNRNVSDIGLMRNVKQDELRRALADVMDRDKRKRKDMKGFIGDLDIKIAKIEECHEKHGCDEFIWRIDRFSQRRRDAQNGGAVKMLSEPFYSHRNGYKLRLVVYPDGNCSGKGTHLSVYFQLMRGEFDAILSWPMKRSVEIAVVNQQPNSVTEHRLFQYSLFPETARSSLHQPVDQFNASCGTPKFIGLDCLVGNCALIKDDQIFIKCFVSAQR